jgi:hypothetical protein
MLGAPRFSTCLSSALGQKCNKTTCTIQCSCCTSVTNCNWCKSPSHGNRPKLRSCLYLDFSTDNCPCFSGTGILLVYNSASNGWINTHTVTVCGGLTLGWLFTCGNPLDTSSCAHGYSLVCKVGNVIYAEWARDICSGPFNGSCVCGDGAQTPFHVSGTTWWNLGTGAMGANNCQPTNDPETGNPYGAGCFNTNPPIVPSGCPQCFNITATVYEIISASHNGSAVPL